MSIPFQRSKKGITLKIKVEPRSARKGIAGIAGDTVKVKVHAPPVGGAANEELIEVLSEKFSIRKSSIRILRGESSKNKVVEIEGLSSVA